MSEISVQFKNQLNGYNKNEVDLVLKKIEGELQQRAATIDAMQQKIEGLEAKLEQLMTPEAVEAAEKIELYDKLMKKMDGDFRNILAPAQAKAKAIEEKAQFEYEVRMEQAKTAAEELYAMTAERITDAVSKAVSEEVEANMDRLYQLLEDYIYSKTLSGRFNSFRQSCDKASMKVATGIVNASQIPGKAARVVSKKVKGTLAQLDEMENSLDSNEGYDL